MEVRAAGSEREGTFELAARRAHREHRRRSLVDDAEFAVAVMPAAVAAGVRTEEEAGEEDDGDDEDDARDDADPGGHCGEAAVASRLGDYYRRLGGRFSGNHWTGRRFRRRRCFAHEFEDASDGDVSVMNWL